MRLLLVLLALSLLIGCAQGGEEVVKKELDEEDYEVATFAGGCFWCMEAPLEQVEGVVEVVSGFTDGEVENPSYEEVSSGTTGHVEAVQVYYDPEKVSYEELLDVYWRQIDPTDDGGQFADRGGQYTTAIFYHDDKQRELAEESKEAMQESGIFDGEIVTPIKPFKEFYRAEEYHQDYYEKHSVKYKTYKYLSGRTPYLKKTWGDVEEEMSEEDLKDELTEMQYKVTQEDGTEPAFDNEYWNNTEEGIYVDVVSGEPLFSSTDKFKSGTGWPSFTKPLEPDNIVEKKDFKLVWPRTEVRSKEADSHLGHVFKDGPEPTGLRYCVNSAALEFIPKEDLEEEGYGEYAELFED